jgi:ATP-grasp domain, R2K clade family 2
VLVEGDRRQGATEDEERTISNEAIHRGFKVEYASRRGLAATLEQPRTLVAGSISFVGEALTLLGRSIPDPVDYPSSLDGCYERRFWKATVGGVRRLVEDGCPPVFVKPAARRKRFIGSVLAGPEDLWRLSSVGRNLPVVCSEVVWWTTEWRAFVTAGELVGLRHYDGDETLQPDVEVVTAMIEALVHAQQSPAGFALDVGVLLWR